MTNGNCFRLQVLLVDDQPLVRTLVAQSLKAMGL